MVLGVEPLGGDLIIRVEPWWWDKCLYKKNWALSLSLSLCHERIPEENGQLQAREKTFTKNWAIMVPWPRTSNLKKFEK